MNAHKDCGCVICDSSNLLSAHPGGLYKPRRNKTASPQYPPYWNYLAWAREGWTRRFGGAEVFTVVKFLSSEESPDDAHLHPVLCLSTCGKQFVTSAMWITEA